MTPGDGPDAPTGCLPDASPPAAYLVRRPRPPDRTSEGHRKRRSRWRARVVGDWGDRGVGSGGGRRACRSRRRWWLSRSSSRSSSPSGRDPRARPRAPPRPVRRPRIATPGQASTSSAGVTAHTITVVFPVSNLVAGGELGFAGHRVQRAGQGDQPVRQADQRRRWNQRSDDHARDRQLRSHRRGRDAGPVQAVDRGERRRLRRARRGGHLVGRQSAVHHPGGAHAPHQSVDHCDQLDGGGLAVPVVDGPRRCEHPRRPRSSGG